jgi:hypothetical protein
MSPRRRRLAVAAVAALVMLVVAAVQREGEPPRHAFRITVGLTDKAPTDWNGKVAVADGEAVELTGWRFEEKDAVDGTSGWNCRTHEYIAPGAHYPLQPAEGKPTPPPQAPWPNGVTLTVKGKDPAVTLTLKQGEIKFKAADVLLGEPKAYLDGRVRVERLPLTGVLRPAAPPRTERAVQDDYPAFWIRYRTNKHYLAWVAYQKEKDRVLLVERDGPDGAWSEPIEIAGPGDHFRVALATTHDDTLWIVWASQRDKKWNLFGRPYKNGKLGDEVRLTDTPGPNLWHVMTTDNRGRAWLAWQGFHDGQSDVYARCFDDDGWHDPVQVSTAKANDWNPALAADTKEDRVWVGWDTYDSGNYGVRVRPITGGPKAALGETLTPEKSDRFQAHVSLACDRAGKLWVAWDEAGPQWGKDTGFLYPRSGGERLYQQRQVRVRILKDNAWLEPATAFDAALPTEQKEYNELPQLQPDGEGRMWLAFRHRTCRRPRIDGWAIQGRWDVYATAWLGDRWTAPVELPHSGGRNDMRTSSQRDRQGNVYFAHASDNRGWVPPGMGPRNLSVAVSRLGGAPKPLAEERLTAARPAPAVVPAIHPKETEDVARVRGYKIDSGGKTYRIYRGDIHRHTDISPDGIGDGSVMDLHRYALDAAAFDFIFVTDHNMGADQEYPWWRTQKANDLYTVPGTFISMYGYERSVPYPNGHRNVIWTERGHRTLPIPGRMQPNYRKLMEEDTAKLYAYLRNTGGICTLHTSATDQGTNWETPIDRELEPVVELYQGYHTSYEAPGAPLTVDEKTDQVHGPYKADGFVSLALDKGYRLGFQSSSDHISTHVSYACILAEEFSRKGLFDALRKRHSYAASDNIVLDVRMGDNLMGDEVKTAKPEVSVTVLGTGPLERVEVLRDGEVVHTERPTKEAAEARFRWEDPAPKKGEKASYYYVRVQQKNGHAAWSSPIWVTAK